MIPLHHSLWDGSLIEVILTIVLSVALASLTIFAIFWFKFKIWSGTRLGQTALMVNFALMILATVEILNLLHLDLGGYLKMAAWILVTFSIIIRTIYMLEGKSSYDKREENSDRKS